MTDRTDYALAHPAQGPEDVLRPELSRTVTLPGGNLLRSILAVDR